MGMYDYVNVEIACPKCKNILKDFQTKDYKNMLSKVDPTEIENFYTVCKKCDLWVEFDRTNDCKLSRKKPFGMEELKKLGFEIRSY